MENRFQLYFMRWDGLGGFLTAAHGFGIWNGWEPRQKKWTIVGIYMTNNGIWLNLFFFWRGVAKNIAIFGGFNPPFSDWQAKAARIPSVETLIASSWLKSSGGESVIQSPYMWEIYRKNLDFLWI